MIIANLFRVFISQFPCIEQLRQDPPPTSMSSSSLAANAASNQTSRDSFSTAMTKNAIVLVLAITITIVNCALIQTIRKHQVYLFVAAVVVSVSIWR